MVNAKKQGKKLLPAVIAAVVLFVLTFAFYTGLNTFFQSSLTGENEIADWKFVCAATEQGIEGTATGFKQASSSNKVSKELFKKYIRLQYTLPASSTPQKLTLKTANNVMKVTVDDNIIADNGYGEKSFSGSQVLVCNIPSGGERTVDVYVYAPLSFEFRAELSDTYTAANMMSDVAMPSVSLAVAILGIILIIYSIAISADSANTAKLLLLSLNILAAGLTGIIYSISAVSSAFSAPFWYSVLLSLQPVLMLLMTVAILKCCRQPLKPVIAAIPSAVLVAVLIIFNSATVAFIAIPVFAVTELFLALVGLRAFSASSYDRKGVSIGLIRGLLLYSALTGLYNSICLMLGLGVFSTFIQLFSMVLLSFTMYIDFSRQVVYVDIREEERNLLVSNDSKWVENLAKMISDMFVQKDEKQFLNKVSSSMISILSQCSDEQEKLNIHVCAAVCSDDSDFEEIYNPDSIRDCSYKEISDYLIKRDPPYIIGAGMIDMLFYAENNHRAVIHFENITGGVNESMSNVVKAAFGNLFFAFRNLNIRSDISQLQETMFIQLSKIVEQRTEDAEKHQKVVTLLVRELCLILGYDEDTANLVSVASMVHDIGKIAITDNILCKTGKLTNDEYEQMKLHVAYGYNILSIQKGKFFEVASIIALQHHENYDGTGYLGLAGDDIDINARIVRIIDVFDALLMERCYKKEWSTEDTLNYIRNGRGTLFDPVITRRFLENSDRFFALRNSVYLEDEKNG